MSNIPLFTTAIRAYEHGKATSRMVKFGAEMMEETVKTMTRPVMGRLPVNQLDEFACRQLDRFGRYGGKPEDPSPPQVESKPGSVPTSNLDPGFSPRGRKHLWTDSDSRVPSSRDSSLAPSSDAGLSPTSPRIQGDSHWTAIANAQSQQQSSGQEVQVASRSKWQAVLLEAGGIGAAVSEESMKRLKYCLQWLQVSWSLVFFFWMSREIFMSRFGSMRIRTLINKFSFFARSLLLSLLITSLHHPRMTPLCLSNPSIFLPK